MPIIRQEAKVFGGDTGNDILTGGVGNDTQDGRIGNDTYVFNLGAGADTINNCDTTASVDTVAFGDGIVLADLPSIIHNLL